MLGHPIILAAEGEGRVVEAFTSSLAQRSQQAQPPPQIGVPPKSGLGED